MAPKSPPSLWKEFRANNGLLLQVDDFLKNVGRLAAAAGSLFILDEVITGFRTAFGWHGRMHRG